MKMVFSSMLKKYIEHLESFQGNSKKERTIIMLQKKQLPTKVDESEAQLKDFFWRFCAVDCGAAGIGANDSGSHHLFPASLPILKIRLPFSS